MAVWRTTCAISVAALAVQQLQRQQPRVELGAVLDPLHIVCSSDVVEARQVVVRSQREVWCLVASSVVVCGCAKLQEKHDCGTAYRAFGVALVTRICESSGFHSPRFHNHLTGHSAG